MNENHFPAHLRSDGVSLSSRIKSTDSSLAHLSSIVGGHIHKMDGILGKISGKSPVKQKVPKIRHVASPFSSGQLLSGVLGGVGSLLGVTKSQWSGVGTMLSGGTSSRMSQNQMLSELAAAITLSIGRDL